jgi:uncharacterized protein
MSRPCKKRRVTCNPLTTSFQPQGEEKENQESVVLSIDELEAIRLADYDGLYQVQAAKKMNVSRQTFGNIIMAAHKKVADFLINSKRLSVEGGSVDIGKCSFICQACNHGWSIKRGAGKPVECPVCKSSDFCCAKKMGNGKNNQTCWRNQ